MEKKYIAISLLIALGMSLAVFGQYAEKHATRLAPRLLSPASDVAENYSKSPASIGDTVGTAVLAALMPNAFTAQSPYSGQIYNDPYSGVLTIIHRGDLTNNPGSGYLWYAASLDAGATWFDVGAFNPPGVVLGRHPNMVLSNPNKSSDPFDPALRPIMLWNDLGPIGSTVWRNLVGAADDALLNGTPINHSVVSDTLFVNAMDANDQTGAAYASVEDINAAGTNVGGFRFFWSENQGAVWNESNVIPASFIDSGSKIIWGPDGLTGYFLYQGVWNINIDPNREFMWGYAKTTDGGATWSDPTPVPMHTIEGMPANYDFLSFHWDGIVDMNGDLHFLGYYSENGTADTGVFEVYWNGANWALTKIQSEVNGQWSLPDGGGSGLITQSEPDLARNLAGDIIYAKWIDLPDTTQLFSDIYVSARFVDGGEWGEPINVTQSPAIFEKMTKMAPRVTEVNDGLGSGLLHIYYTIFGDRDTNELSESQAWYLKNVTVTPPAVVTGIEDGGVQPKQFALHQNFPNPFNPSTTISFSLQTSAEITLEVYSITGQKVATLVNGLQNAGEHKITFQAGNLGSGVYFYKLTSGSFSETRKMVLMK
jgi:hypothetical protein